MKLCSTFRLLVTASAFAALACDPGVAPLVPTTMEATTDVTQAATVGSAVAEPPTVRVLDQDENPLADIEVAWTVTAGGGTVQKATDTTDVDGIASAGTWTLGTTTGNNAMRASIPAVEGADAIAAVVFNAMARAGPAASMLIVEGNNQSASTGLQVVVRPSVRVADQYGNPIANATVVFQIALGGGTVIAGTQSTGQNGVASVGGWTMGATAGQNKLNATVANLGFVQFTANAVAAPQCLTHAVHTLGTTVTGSLQSTDCLLPGSQYNDFYDVVNPIAQAIRFDQQSTDFVPYLQLFDTQGNALAEDLTSAGNSAVSSVTIIAPATTLVIGASSFLTQRLGNYGLLSSTVSGLGENCTPIFVLRGIATNQNLSNTDCLDTTGPYYFERFYIRLIAGIPVTLRMSSAVFDTYLDLQRVTPTGLPSVASNNNENQSTTNSRITFTPQLTGYYVIVTSSQVTSATGAYTLTIDPP